MFKNLNTGALGHAVPFDRTCALAKQYGFAGVDLDLDYLMKFAESQSLQAAQEWFAQTGLRPGAIGLSAKWREGDSDAAFEESLMRLAEEARLAAALGCTRCVTWIAPGSNTLNFYQHWDFAVPRLQRVAAVLAEHGLRLGMEFIGPGHAARKVQARLRPHSGRDARTGGGRRRTYAQCRLVVGLFPLVHRSRSGARPRMPRPA